MCVRYQGGKLFRPSDNRQAHRRLRILSINLHSSGRLHKSLGRSLSRCLFYSCVETCACSLAIRSKLKAVSEPQPLRVYLHISSSSRDNSERQESQTCIMASYSGRSLRQHLHFDVSTGLTAVHESIIHLSLIVYYIVAHRESV